MLGSTEMTTVEELCYQKPGEHYMCAYACACQVNIISLLIRPIRLLCIQTYSVRPLYCLHFSILDQRQRIKTTPADWCAHGKTHSPLATEIKGGMA